MRPAALLPICALGSCITGMAQEARQPNILFIEVDQHRYDCTEMTSDAVRTPHLDRLARQGTQFSNAYCPIPTSCPARQCLLSGLWPEQHHGLWNWDITLKAPEFDAPTWSEALAAQGRYKLGYVGKWHVHPEKTPLDYGFDDYIPEKGPYDEWRKSHQLPAFVNFHDGPYFGGYDPVGKDSTKTHWLARQAIALIREYAESGQPWLVRLEFSEPHLPCFPAKEFFDRYDPDAIPAWANFSEDFTDKPYIQEQQLYNWGIEDFTWDNWKEYVRRYYAMITQVDDAVGLVLKELKKSGLDKNTLVIYTSDHGDACGSHRMIDKHYVLYDEEVRVPLVMRWPGVIRKGIMDKRFIISALDLAATIAEVTGLDFPTQGQSLLPLFSGDPIPWRDCAFSNYNGQQFGLVTQRMIRTEHTKYVWNLTDVDELYDLDADPAELHNLIHDPAYAPILAELRKRLYESLLERKDPIARQEAAKYQLLQGKKK